MTIFWQVWFKRFQITFAAVICMFALGHSLRGQDTLQSNSNQSANTSATEEIVRATPIPVPDVVSEAETVTSILKEIASGVTADDKAGIIERDLPVLVREIDARMEATAPEVNNAPSLEKLKGIEAGWESFQSRTSKLNTTLTDLSKGLEAEIKRLEDLNKLWTETTDRLKSSGSPPELISRAEETLQAIAQTRKQIETEQARIVALQERVAGQQARIDQANASIKQKRDSLVGNLFVQDSPTIWTGEFWRLAGLAFTGNAAGLFRQRISNLDAFANQNSGRIVFHVLIFVLLVGMLVALRRRAQPWVEKEPELLSAAIIFNYPISTALILAVLASFWIYPEIPQIIKPIFGAIALFPTVLLLRKLCERQIYPILNALVVLFLIDQVRAIAEPLPIIARLLFLGEMLSAFCFLLWIYRTRLTESESEEVIDEQIFRVTKTAALVALPVFVLAFAANATGFVSLSQLLGNGVLKSGYVAVILYACVRIIDGLIKFALRLYPLNKLRMVRNSSALIQSRVQFALRWIAALAWLYTTFNLFYVREPLLGSLWSVLTQQLVIGSIEISLSDILAFALTVWAAFLISRFVRFVLEEDIYPRTGIAKGVPYAISTVLHYTILVIGFFVALGTIGFDLTKFTILVGAFGVGIGFGLQNIVNNFVSGLILLFERPVSVGDMVRIGEDEGKLKSIGLRASVMRTLQGSDVIVPNGDLISGTVVNWTFSDQQRRLELNVGVAYGTDPKKVIEILLRVAGEHPEVIKEPGPRGLFMAFGESSLDFQLRAWTVNFDNWIVVQSELNLAINEALKEADITIPFPQRDLHLVSVNDDFQSGLGLDKKDGKQGKKT